VLSGQELGLIAGSYERGALGRVVGTDTQFSDLFCSLRLLLL
jgi:hypothetical protein